MKYSLKYRFSIHFWVALMAFALPLASSTPSHAIVFPDRIVHSVHEKVLVNPCLIFLAKTVFTRKVELDKTSPSYLGMTVKLKNALPNFRDESLVFERRTYGVYGSNVYWQLRHEDAVIADLATFYDEGLLIFDVTVSPPFTYFGVYKFLMETMLARYPKTRVMPAVMPYQHSDSARVFFRELDRLKKATSLSERERLVEAFRRMPSTKTRIANGFGRLTYLNASIQNGLIQFVMERGESMPDEWEGAVHLQDNPTHALVKYKEIRSRYFFGNVPWWF